MPTQIKITISIITILIGITFYYFETKFGQIDVANVGIFLSFFMVVAMWIFPEAGDRAKK